MSDNIVKINQNGGFSKKLFMIDSKNDVFDITTEIYFDPEIDEIRDYNGKRFELVIKANQRFDPNTEKFNLDEYFFVGIGTWNFDIGLGVAKFDALQDKTYKSFLAAFGDFNTKSIESGVWYRLRVSVIEDRIKIFFNRRDQNERQVISYDISRNRQQKEERYFRGEFEEIVNVISGLDNLDIIYPDKLAQATNEKTSKRLFNEELVKNVRPVGPLSGMVIFNPYSYVGNVSYKSKTQGFETFSGPTKTTERTDILHEISRKYKDDSNNIVNAGRTLSDTFIIQIGNSLYYKLKNNEVNKFPHDVIKTFINQNRVIIYFLSGNKSTVQILNENFDVINNVFVKDNAFNEDYIYKYLQLTNRDIQDVFVSDNKLNVVFEDIE